MSKYTKIYALILMELGKNPKKRIGINLDVLPALKDGDSRRH